MGNIPIALFLMALAFGCSDSSPGSSGTSDAGIEVTADPDSVAEGQMAIIGKVVDYITGTAIGDAFVSTFPPTTTIRTNGAGEFVLTDALVAGQVFEIKGEANGYERRFVPARPVPGGRVTINLPLVPSDRAVPVRFEPSVLVFTSDLQEIRILATSMSDAAVNLAFEPPPWLVTVGAPRPLAGGERQTLTFRIAPDAFADAVGALTEGDSLQAEIKVTDEFKRIGLISVVAVPAPKGLVTLKANSLDSLVVTVGSTIDVALTARYAEQPLLGATVRGKSADLGVVLLEAQERVTGEDGVAVVRLRGEAVGLSTVSAGLPAYPGAPPVSVTVEVRPADGSAPPEGPCAVANGGCKEPTLERCEVNEAGGPTCVDIDECLEDNGQCGEFATCVNQLAAVRTCEDIDECAVNAAGENDCGIAKYWTCINHEKARRECIPVDECEEDNGKCGDVWHHRCVNVENGPHTCEDYEPCVPNEMGETFCGSPLRRQCIDHAEAMPTCLDVDECQPGADGRNGCGAIGRWTCTNEMNAAPVCVPIDACENENGNCGPAEFVDCFDVVDELPACVDKNECRVNNGGCGRRDLNACVNVDRGPPVCSLRDPCAFDEELGYACGDPQFNLCRGALGAAPRCSDRLECEIAPNGRNGCPGLAKDSLCFEHVGAAPDCVPCEPGFSNLDGDAASCEYACDARGEETCNGLDDDCDGDLDNGFDLQRDSENCGACGRTCSGGQNVESATCQLGRCGALRCEAGFYDRDGDVETGCEAALPADVLYVDGERNDPLGDGTGAHPFATIGEAVAATLGTPDRVISVAEGTYAECFTLTEHGTRVIGAGADRTTLACDDPFGVYFVWLNDIQISGIRIATGTQFYGLSVANSDRVVLTDLAIVGYVQGVHISGGTGLRIHGMRVIDSGGGGVTAFGVTLSGLGDVRVTGLTVSGVDGQVNAPTVGLDVINCHEMTLDGIRVEDVQSQVGAGSSVGLRLSGVMQDLTLQDVSIARVTGADASPGADQAGQDGLGVLVEADAEFVVFERVSVTGIRGGRGSATAGGAARGIDVGASNAVDLFEFDVRDVLAGQGEVDVNGVESLSGAAEGIRMTTSSAAHLHNLLVWSVRSPTPNHGVSGIRLDGPVVTEMRGVTVAEIGEPDETEAAGVSIQTEDRFPLRLEDIIVSGVRGPCVFLGVERDVMTLDATLLHDCSDPTVVGPYSEENAALTEDPRFRNRAEGDLHLASDSPAVDAAPRDSPFAREPQPNGGRADLGRYGNTDEATATPP